ncbi:MAG: coiled-coil domain-containing protein [Candidatus Odinarchaeota archaeon]
MGYILMNIERIKKALPEVEHVVMFYDDGTVFKTTFDKPVNIPKLGENISAILTHVRSMYGISNYKVKGDIQKLVIETGDVDVIILKLGEESNLALFFRKSTEEGGLQIDSVKHYIEKIEDLLDIDLIELLKQEIESKVKHLDELYLQAQETQSKLEEQQSLQGQLGTETDKEEIKEISHEIKELNEKIRKVKDDIDKQTEEIARLEKKLGTEADERSEKTI